MSKPTPRFTYGRCNICGNPGTQYINTEQINKIIKNQVRVESSLYTMNLAALYYQKKTRSVNW